MSTMTPVCNSIPLLTLSAIVRRTRTQCRQCIRPWDQMPPESLYRTNRSSYPPNLFAGCFILASRKSKDKGDARMAQRRAYSIKPPGHDGTNEPYNSHHNRRLSHSHPNPFSKDLHAEDHSHTHGTEQIIAALKGHGDRGSKITLIGLVSNIGLTAGKGLAGWYMHSASLLADAGHSLSDLLGDFVTLICWRLSRKPPSEKYPYGFAKLETIGTSIISVLLVGGALGIGFHSYHLLISAAGHSAAALPPGLLHEALTTLTSTAPRIPAIGHEHIHAVDPNAAWFAAVSVLAKEWLYRITKAVADEEKSPVLTANAFHHRSDAYSSLVAFFAILGTWAFPSFPLDPIGGLLVSLVILRQGLDLLTGAWNDITDAGVSLKTRRSIEQALSPLVTSSDPSSPLVEIRDLRARHSGSLMFVDFTALVTGTMTISDASVLDEKITRTLMKAKKEITEVRVKFEPWIQNESQLQFRHTFKNSKKFIHPSPTDESSR